jgi:hypothetical protein
MAPGFADTLPNGQIAQLWRGANGGAFPLLTRGVVEIV